MPYKHENSRMILIYNCLFTSLFYIPTSKILMFLRGQMIQARCWFDLVGYIQSKISKMDFFRQNYSFSVSLYNIPPRESKINTNIYSDSSMHAVLHSVSAWNESLKIEIHILVTRWLLWEKTHLKTEISHLTIDPPYWQSLLFRILLSSFFPSLSVK